MKPILCILVVCLYFILILDIVVDGAFVTLISSSNNCNDGETNHHQLHQRRRRQQRRCSFDGLTLPLSLSSSPSSISFNKRGNHHYNVGFSCRHILHRHGAAAKSTIGGGGGGGGGSFRSDFDKSTSSSIDDNDEPLFEPIPMDNNGWKNDNVYEDFSRLESALIVDNADQDLLHKTNIDIMDYTAKQRRPLFKDIQKFVVLPMIGALLISRVLSSSSSSYSILQKVATIFMLCMDIHFWIVVVSSPIILLGLKRISKQRQQPRSTEQQQPIPDALRKILEDYPGYRPSSYTADAWRDYHPINAAETSCVDNLLFLLEQWVSAVIMMAITPGIICRITGFRPATTYYVSSAATAAAGSGHVMICIWFALSQLMTRIGAIAALYQYPKQMFNLRRSIQKNKPLGILTTLMERITRWMFLFLPLGLTSDITKIINQLGKDTLVSLYSCVTAFGMLIWIRMQMEILSNATTKGDDNSADNNSQQQQQNSFSILRSPSSLRRFRDTIALVLFWRKPIRNYRLARLLHIKGSNDDIITKSSQLLAFLRFVLSSCLFLPPIIFPMCHIVAIGRLFRIVHTHDLSLSSKVKSFKSAINNDELMSQRMKWRYRLEWRDDQRLGETIKGWRKGWFYWLFIQGSPVDLIDKEQKESMRKAALKGHFILDRIEKDIEGTPANAPYDDPKKWKRKAMKNLAERHEFEYKNNTKWMDPLGVAVQQTFGIGLGYAFNHSTPLQDGEVPSLRRLQSRAAKSAIKRVKELTDLQALNDGVSHIDDPTKREKKKEELREMTRTEIKYLAKKLTELVPTGPFSSQDHFDEGKGPKTELFKFKQQEKNYRRVGSHEWRAVGDGFAVGGGSRFRTSSSKAVNDLLGSNRKSKLNIETSPSVDIIVDYDDMDDDNDSEGDDNDNKTNDIDNVEIMSTKESSSSSPSVAENSMLDDVFETDHDDDDDDNNDDNEDGGDNDESDDDFQGDDEFVTKAYRQRMMKLNNIIADDDDNDNPDDDNDNYPDKIVLA